MIKTILVPLRGTKEDVSVLATALGIARPFGAHLDCLHVVPDAAALLPPQGAVEMETAALIAGSLQILEARAKERANEARATFENFCREHNVPKSDSPNPNGVSAALHEIGGDPNEKLVSLSRIHDLTVIAGGPSDDALLRSDLGRLIVSIGKPVVLAPAAVHAPRLRKIAIAWKDCPEAARAVTAAMPLLSKAQRIVVLTANEDDKNPCACLDSYEAVAEQLRLHGMHVEVHYVLPGGRSVPDAILDGVHEVGADMLVMGGYGHSRLREFVFGGFTQRVLQGTDLPVFVFH